ncbi:MAG: GNAT family N-acetyltransferase [Bacteroidia bacterium]
MTVNFLDSTKIDAQKWDYLIHRSDNPSVCAEYWFITQLTKGKWYAYISTNKNGDWEAAMPVFNSKKMGNTFSRQPLLSKYWGVIVKKQNVGLYKQISFAKEHYASILNKANECAVLDYFTGINPTYAAQYSFEKINLNPRFTYLLNFEEGIESLREGYSKTVRKKVNKLKRDGFENVLKQDSNDLEQMLVLNLEEGRELVPAQAINPLKELSVKASELGKGFFLSTLSPQKEVAAAGFFLLNEHYCHFLSGYVNPKYRQQNVMNLLVDGALNRCSTRTKKFDFFGSNIESIEAFFRSFGAYPATYYRIVNAKFPFNLIWKA